MSRTLVRPGRRRRARRLLPRGVGRLVTALTVALPMPMSGIARQDITPPTDSSAIAGHHAAFAVAFNQGTAAAIRDLLERRGGYSPDEIADETAYWLALRAEIGPLQFRGLEPRRRGGRTQYRYWYRGAVTAAWVGITLLTDGDRIRGRAVTRGARPAFATRSSRVPPSAVADSLAAYFRAVTDSGHFAGVVVVDHGGRPVFADAFGYQDREARVRNTLATRFPLASVTKILTGIAIMQLVERGEVALDDPLARFIPEYPEHIGRQVTVHHLLTHTSGIELDDDSIYFGGLAATRSVDDLLALQLSRIEHLNDGRYADFRPLDRYDYTNEGIDLLGVIIERVTGQTWASYLQDHVFGPARMHSGRAALEPGIENLATGYTIRPEDVAVAEATERRPVPTTGGAVARVRPAATASATGPDMAALFRALTNGTLLSRASMTRMMTPHISLPGPPSEWPRRAYGYTMSVGQYSDSVIGVGHAGSAPGMSTFVEYFPHTGHTVVILSNYDNTWWWTSAHVRELLGVY